MSFDLKNKWGTSAQTFTVTLASLGSASARQSTAIDVSAAALQEALVTLTVKSNASGVSATGVVNVYAFGSVDGGTTYSGGAGASDAAITLTSPPNVRLIGTVNVIANATTYTAGPFSVAQSFGGTMPDHWGIIVENQSGAALDSTEGNHLKYYQLVYTTAV